MAKQEPWMITLYSEDGRMLYQGQLTHLMPREDLILAKSVEFFDDPAPCFIHRSAVMKRLFMEAEEFFARQGTLTQEHTLREAPETVADLLRISPQVQRMEVWKKP